MKYAIVKKNISPEIKAGDKLILDSEGINYVKEGQVAEMIESTVRYGFLNLRKRTIITPNHYSKGHVEMMPDYFEVKTDKPAPLKFPTLICVIGAKSITKGRSYEGIMVKLDHDTGKYVSVNKFEDAERFNVFKNDNGKNCKYGIKRFEEASIWPTHGAADGFSEIQEKRKKKR